MQKAYVKTLWLKKGTFDVTELRLVDQVNAIGKNKCMTELEVEYITRQLKQKDQEVEQPNGTNQDEARCISDIVNAK